MEFANIQDPPMKKSESPARNKMTNSEMSAIASSKNLTMKLLQNTYSQSFQSINMGFSLAAALAWNEVVKEFITKNISVKKGTHYHLIYAIVVTLLAAVVFMITKSFLDKSVQKVAITPILR